MRMTWGTGVIRVPAVITCHLAFAKTKTDDRLSPFRKSAEGRHKLSLLFEMITWYPFPVRSTAVARDRTAFDSGVSFRFMIEAV